MATQLFRRGHRQGHRQGNRQPSHGSKKSAKKSIPYLPPELREKILRYCFIVEGGIEFCPEPFRWVPGNKDWKYKDHGVFDRAYAYQSARIGDSLSPYLGLLGVSKDFSYHALQVLYGANEFRFTNTAGWYGLDLFLYQIGPHNKRRLRNVTVIHPDFSVIPRSLSQADQFVIGFTGGINRQPRVQLQTSPPNRQFGYFTRWFDNDKYERFLWRPFRELEKFGTLRHLRVVYPRGINEEDLEWVSSPVREHKFRNLTITVLKVNRGMTPGIAHATLLPGVIPEGASAKQIATRWADVNWRFEDIEIDNRGDYKTTPL